ncbi:MAG: hypothetical protein GC165_16990 [Armatimonadetes bacterium]|nr:hypothetical protein [Armatimonadota bacterium]
MVTTQKQNLGWLRVIGLVMAGAIAVGLLFVVLVKGWAKQPIVFSLVADGGHLYVANQRGDRFDVVAGPAKPVHFTEVADGKRLRLSIDSGDRTAWHLIGQESCAFWSEPRNAVYFAASPSEDNPDQPKESTCLWEWQQGKGFTSLQDLKRPIVGLSESLDGTCLVAVVNSGSDSQWQIATFDLTSHVVRRFGTRVTSLDVILLDSTRALLKGDNQVLDLLTGRREPWPSDSTYLVAFDGKLWRLDKPSDSQAVEQVSTDGKTVEKSIPLPKPFPTLPGRDD